MRIKNALKNWRRDPAYRGQMKMNAGRRIQFYNFWAQKLDQMYWNRWFEARPILLSKCFEKKVGFFSVFGNKGIIDHTDCDVNIFYSAENIHQGSFLQYSDYYLLDGRMGLSMGFDYFEHEKYIRFPNWMDVFFLTLNDVKDVCDKLRYPDISGKSRFCALVSSHDRNGVRTSIVNSINNIDDVSCGGRFMHNDDALRTEFSDDKMQYLRQFIFNICPENSNSAGYVTEKIFQSIFSGCIPIYWGSNNRPELDVLNKDAIILWNRHGNNDDNVKLITDLMESPKLLNDFIKQPRLLPSAEEYISYTIRSVERSIEKLLL